MKKQITIILALAAAMGLSSCSKNFLNQTDPNAITVGDYFATENDVLLAVNGVYQSLRSENCIGENSGLFTEERSDNTGRNDNQSNSGEPFQFGDFSILPSNTYLSRHWLALYETVSRANTVLSNIDKVTFNNEDTRAGYKAEVKFLRALIYFHLVRKWGDVPLVTKQLSTTADISANTFRTKDTAVYSQIIADLQDVLASPLPNFQTGANIGRISKAAGNALLGQVYLTMATTIDDGKRDEHLAQANTYLSACYNMRNFGQLKEIPYTDVFDVSKKTSCPELILQIVYKQGDATYSSSIAANNQAKGETINSKKEATGVGGNVTGDLVNEYESGDLRKDYSIKYANASIVKDWFITKFRDTSAAAGTNGYGGNDFILIRYADVILMLAEVNMYQGNNTAAIQYLDMVRARAGMPDYATSMMDAAYSAKYPTLKLAILHERRSELAFENHRWYDLLRTFTTDELISYFHAKDQAYFGNARLSNFSSKDRYYPIPYDEWKLDPVKMYQNTGY
ncbi:RagB/SusD family nutrient uptake outer membrane protein [Chitinophaga tropicalis]|uniref:RagB/SusD family nutrient uptake outer membrane protein n=1 Tax=Chitinophaga tropicalis TaxID=2683588 RepID=A0A7K1U172_9BACT|nr:RagB/SusD family nutrient uptake outer membrane protein [Chitinophaga tropicalis]MVT08036.1 RagB/SusD family nutrient uptake outer membrane protein [Chitinophaga tropicalis]